MRTNLGIPRGRDGGAKRAGYLTRPKGQFKLTMSANKTIQDGLLHMLGALAEAA